MWKSTPILLFCTVLAGSVGVTSCARCHSLGIETALRPGCMSSVTYWAAVAQRPASCVRGMSAAAARTLLVCPCLSLSLSLTLALVSVPAVSLLRCGHDSWWTAGHRVCCDAPQQKHVCALSDCLNFARSAGVLGRLIQTLQKARHSNPLARITAHAEAASWM